MTTRTLTAPRPGPVALSVDLPAGDVRVITDPARTVAEVTVTAHGDDPAVHDAVRGAVLRWYEATGNLTVRVNAPAGGVTVVGGAQTVVGNGAATVVQSYGGIPAGVRVTGGTVISGGGIVNIGGGSVTVNGVEITGGGLVAGGWVQITAVVPEGTSVTASTRSASLECAGEFAEVDFTSTSGDLTAGGLGALRAKTTSGDVHAAVVDGAASVASVSGDVYLGRGDDVTASTTSGDVTVNDFAGRAEVASVSGDVRVRAAEGGAITARSVSGNVTVTATGTALAEGLTVNATSRTGRVTTPNGNPSHAASAARARRPRRTNGGA
ncbi:hypothetical protein E1264_39040 [Actinomadura sp. KC216]|uniref:DUF4097 family beta strand repeat-containing protein n=1 Tax=Actinomadura sp. KC216 TaxID=2530370 RepID=UPI001048FBB2|nr:DUF4097 family beta strand repeat-containing protein [Actinomadura sp. KC216]TDB76060.1 hypothetical protein E1264_39040 [Actinomadura sp. KC216]